MAVDIQSRCRICLSESKTMHYLFGELVKGCLLSEMVRKALNSVELTIQENDGLSSFICSNCMNIILSFINLKETFIKNTEHIKKLLKNEEKNVNDNSNKRIRQKNRGNKSTATLRKKDVHLEGLSENDEVSVKSEKIKQEDLNILTETESAKSCGRLTGSLELKDENNTKKEDNEEFVSELDEETFFIIHEDESDNEGKATLTEEDSRTVKGETSEECQYQGEELNDDLYKLEESKKYSCPHCVKYFFDFKHFQAHMLDCHQIESVVPNMYSTPLPLKVKKDLKKNKEFTCTVCKEKFIDEEVFKSHVDTHRNYVCELCGMGFTKRSYLSDHKEVHLTERNYVCSVCNKAFKRRTVLVKHKRLHTRPRQIVCEHCGKTFNEKGTMKTHVSLVHMKERNFKCLICGLTFPLKSTLQKHILRHNKDREKMYVCTKCDISYKDSSSLRRHHLMKHDENYEKFPCEFCGKDYTSITNLKRHKIKHHKVIPNHVYTVTV